VCCLPSLKGSTPNMKALFAIALLACSTIPPASPPEYVCEMPCLDWWMSDGDCQAVCEAGPNDTCRCWRDEGEYVN